MGVIMETTKEVCLTHSREKLDMMLSLGFSDYAKRYDLGCSLWGFKKRFSDKFGVGVYAWYDSTGTAFNYKPVFRWVD